MKVRRTIEDLAIGGVVIFLAAGHSVDGVLFVARSGEYGLPVGLTLLSIGCSRLLMSMRQEARGRGD